MTVPSKTWIRSLSPSTPRTWTRTVSPGLNVGTSLRSCSASIRSIGFVGGLIGEQTLLAAPAETVKDYGGRRPDREVVPAVGAADGLEEVVDARQHLPGEPPSGPQNE